MNIQIHLLDPADLHIHSQAQLIPEWSKDCPEFHCLVEDIREHGIIEPIVCVKPNLVLLGRARWRAARQLQLEIPVRWCDGAEIFGLLLGSLLHRQHLALGARAYLAVPLLPGASAERDRKRLQNIKKGQQTPETLLVGTQASFAKSHGISLCLFEQAVAVRKHFENKDKFTWEDGENPTQILSLKEYFEPRILASYDEKPLGLGAVIAGIGAKLSGKTLSQREQKQLDLFTGGVGTLITRFSYWKNFDKETRAEAMDDVRKELDRLDYDDTREMAKWFSDMARVFRKEAKKKTKPKTDKQKAA